MISRILPLRLQHHKYRFYINEELSHDQIEKSGCMAAFLSEKRKKLGSGRVFLNYDVL